MTIVCGKSLLNLLFLVTYLRIYFILFTRSFILKSVGCPKGAKCSSSIETDAGSAQPFPIPMLPASRRVVVKRSRSRLPSGMHLASAQALFRASGYTHAYTPVTCYCWKSIQSSYSFFFVYGKWFPRDA